MLKLNIDKEIHEEKVSPNNILSGNIPEKELFPKLDLLGTKELKDKIKEIFKRRNSIVHQMDYNYSTKSQQSITKEEVEEYIKFYDRFIQELHILLQENI